MQILQRCVVVFCAALLTGLYCTGRDVAGLQSTFGAVSFTDRNGAPLGTILASDSSHAVGVPLVRVSPQFRLAIVAAEDARFATHNALDVRSIARAARDLVIYGEVRSGASTITMQLARLLYPGSGGLRGKALQILEAQRIAVRSERDAILEAYVNRLPMGGNLYGVEAAARAYFGEPAADLDLAQAALLAGVPNDPARLAPDEHLHAARTRAGYVLARMVSTGAATLGNTSGARSETLTVRRRDEGITDAPHALFLLYSGGAVARVQTTIDRDLQRFVQAQTQSVIAALGARHVSDAAVLVVDNRTGDVLAYVGSPDYFSDEQLGRNDGVQALRQPGSSLKPFTYELALERGTIRTTTILDDVPSTFALPGGKLYAPVDYNGRFAGPVRVRYALANSLNVPAVRVLQQLGPDALLDRLHALGFSHLDKPASYYGLGLTLGGGEVSLWENVRAYVAMARGGDAIPIALTAHDARPQPIGIPATWTLVTGMLADSHARVASFGRHSVLDMPFDAAVKTGTSSDFRDTWTIGFTRDYTVGVWVGNFDGTEMHEVSGVTGAGPLWNRIMMHLHERSEPRKFSAPPGYALASICATTGDSPAQNCPAVVQEWVGPHDATGIRERATRATSRFHITDPQDGAVF
ncbi:MAG: penicillin-binding protein 1C, partial [Candidatus Eremiobacteraeota bacterium]|nr:penicillin-binding protein 1C [Candidatus Eremiobacteraeota bacterium]